MVAAVETGGTLTGTSGRLGLVVGLAFYLDSAALVCIAVGLPVWRAAFRLSAVEVSLIGGGSVLAVALGSLVGGRLGDRVGRLRVFTIDLGLFAVGALVLATADRPALVVVGAVAVGVAAGADIPTGLAAIAESAPPAVRGRLTGATQVAWIAAVLVTYSLAVAVSGLGLVGVRLLVGHLLALALLTLVLRTVALGGRNGLRRPPTPVPCPEPVGRLLGAERRPLVLLGGFYLVWSLAATTLGSYGAYFLVEVTRLTQRAATSLVLFGFLPAVGMAVLFSRLADTRWRKRLFPVAAVLQVTALALAAATGGTAATGMASMIVLYSLSNVFAGEAAFKVWAQLLLDENSRATVLGTCYAAAKITSGAFLLVVPYVIDTRPELLLWAVCALFGTSGLLGLGVIRQEQRRRAPDLRD